MSVRSSPFVQDVEEALQVATRRYKGVECWVMVNERSGAAARAIDAATLVPIDACGGIRRHWCAGTDPAGGNGKGKGRTIVRSPFSLILVQNPKPGQCRNAGKFGSGSGTSRNKG
jgi:hypothetical protein